MSGSLGGTLDLSSQITTQGAFCLSSDGLKLYALDDNDNTLYQYSVSTAWDLTGTVTYDSKSLDLSTYTYIDYLFLGNSDATLILADSASAGADATMREWNLSTAKDISTATDSTNFIDVSNAGSHITSDGTQLSQNNAGTKSRQYHQVLTNAWNLSATSSSNFNTFARWMTDAFWWSTTKLIGDIYGTARVYDLSTEKSLSPSSVSEGQFYPMTDHASDPRSLKSNSAGTKLYFSSATNGLIYQIETSTAYEFYPVSTSSPYIVHQESQYNTAATGLTFSVPSNLEDDDIIYFWCSKDDDAGGDWSCTGFTNLDNHATTSGNDVNTGLLRKVITNAAGESSYTVSTTDSDSVTVGMIVVRNGDTTTPEDGVTIAIASSDNTTSPTHSGVTTSTDNALILTGIGGDAGNSVLVYSSPITATSPASLPFLNHILSNTGGAQGIASGVKVSAGATGTVTWTSDSSTAENHVVTWAVKPGSSTTTYDGTATFAGAGTLSGDGAATLGASATFTGAGSFAGTGSVVYSATSAFDGAGTFAATGEQITVYSGTATFAGAGVLSGTGVAVRASTADFTGAATFSGNGSHIVASTASFNGTAVLVGTGEYIAGATTYDGLAAFSGAGSLVATGNHTYASSAVFNGAGTFSALGEEIKLYTGTASFTGSGTFSGIGSTLYAGAALFNGAGTFSGAANTTYAATADFTGAGSFVASGNYVYSASSAFAASGTFAAAGEQLTVYYGTSAFTGTGASSATGKRIVSGAAVFSGAATWSGTGQGIYPATAAFAGTGNLVATGEALTLYPGTASFSGAGTTTTSNGVVTRAASAAFSGAAIVVADGEATYNAVASFSAAASLAATGLQTTTYAGTSNFAASAAFTGIGTVTRSAIASFAGAATLSGNGYTQYGGTAAFAASGLFEGVGTLLHLNLAEGYLNAELEVSGERLAIAGGINNSLATDMAMDTPLATGIAMGTPLATDMAMDTPLQVKATLGNSLWLAN